MAKKAKADKSANYNFASQKEPKTPMGHGSFANMPEKGMIRGFPHKPNYRDGIINDFVADLDMLSDIEENQC